MHDPSGIMSTHTYSWHAEIPGSFGIPAEWRDYQCQITLTAGLPDAVDTFRLVDVAVVARKIMDECVPMSKIGLGGLGLVGHRQGLFVAVNGPAPPGGVGMVEERNVEDEKEGKGEGSWWDVLKGGL